MVEDLNWIRRQVINSWFEIAQEKIAEQLNISVGKVNSIIQEYTKSNDWAEKARDMFISAKKNGVEINQLISNLRYENGVKKYASNRDKIELLLRGLDHLVEENSGDPTITASLIYQIIVLALKEHKYPRQILEELQSSSQQYREIKDKIQREKLLLQKYNVTLDEIVKFNELRINLGDLGITELNQINNLIINIREQGHDHQRVIQIVSKFTSLLAELQGIQRRLREELANLTDIEVESNLRREAIHTYSGLGRRGYSEQGIADILKVVDDLVQEHVHSPGMGNVNGLIAWLRNEIEKFGSLAVVNINLLYQNKDLTSKILQSKEGLGYEQQYSGQNKFLY